MGGGAVSVWRDGVMGPGSGCMSTGEHCPGFSTSTSRRDHARTQTSGGVHRFCPRRDAARRIEQASRTLLYRRRYAPACSARSQWCLTGPSESA